MHRRGLGRGLDALLGSPPPSAAAEQASTMTHEEASSEIALDLIEVNPRQPRKTFDPVTLDELARSIKTSGVIQPIVVRKAPSGAGWQLVAGERRWRAARMAGLEKIPAVVREVTDAESLELALVENLLREDLNPMEEAEAYQQILTEFDWTQEQLAERIGKDRSTIANALRLMRLPDVIQEDLRAGRLTMGHARACPSRSPRSSCGSETRSSPTPGRSGPRRPASRSAAASPRLFVVGPPRSSRSRSRSSGPSSRACASSETSGEAASRSPIRTPSSWNA